MILRRAAESLRARIGTLNNSQVSASLIVVSTSTIAQAFDEASLVTKAKAGDADAFATYWQERAELVRVFARIVKSGIKTGLFRQVPAELCAHTIVAQNESVQNWRRKNLDGAGPTPRSTSEPSVGSLATETR